MARYFAISQTTDTVIPEVTPDGSGRGEVAYTVTNQVGRAVRARATITPEDKATESWVSIPDAEREYRDGGSQQLTAKVVVPKDAAPRDYKFLFDVAEVTNPEQIYEQGPPFIVKVTARAEPIVEPPVEKKSKAWIFILLGVVAALILGGVAFFMIRNGGEEGLPDVTGLSLDSASTVLDKAGLTDSLAGDSFTGLADPGIVIRQEPASESAAQADTAFKTSGIVRLWVESDVAVLPLVEGVPLASARELLDARGFRDSVVGDSVTTRVAEGTVLHQDPKPDSAAGRVRFPKNLPVQLWVEGRSVEVPNVIGASVPSAMDTLTRRGLTISARDRTTRVAAEGGRVLDQEPRHPQKLAFGAPVVLHVGRFVECVCRGPVGLPLCCLVIGPQFEAELSRANEEVRRRAEMMRRGGTP